MDPVLFGQPLTTAEYMPNRTSRQILVPVPSRPTTDDENRILGWPGEPFHTMDPTSAKATMRLLGINIVVGVRKYIARVAGWVCLCIDGITHVTQFTHHCRTKRGELLLLFISVHSQLRLML